MSILRVAVVGAGIMGRTHASVVADYHRAHLTAICSRNAERAGALARAYAAPLVFTDYRDLLSSPEVDAVIIATPDFAHHDIAVAAAHAGKHMLVEKPLATDLAEADSIVAAVETAGVVGSTLFNHRWIPAYYQAKQRIVAGDLGRPRMAYARKNDTIYVPTEMISWADQTTSAWFLSAHDIDLVTWYFADEAVEAHASGVRGVLSGQGIDTYDAIQAQVRYRSGAIATFESCWIYPNTFPTMVDSWVAITCEQGVIHMDRKEEQIQVAGPQRFEFPRNLLLLDLTGHPQGSVRHAITHWIDCALDGATPLVTLRHARHVTAILTAIHRSLAENRAIPVE
jgi:predicted dehydrogenase